MIRVFTCLALGLLVRISVVARKIRVTVDAADDVQLVVPIATDETVRVLTQLIDARSKHYVSKFKKRTIAQGDAIVELQIDGAALFDDDHVGDILGPDDVVRAIWAGRDDAAAEYTVDTGDRHPEPRIKPNASPHCGRFSACPPCTQASCFWCSSTHSCVDRATSACPLQKPRSSCLDFNLHNERESFLRPCVRKPSPWNRRSTLCCGDHICSKSIMEDSQSCLLDCPAPTQVELENGVYDQSNLPPKRLPAVLSTFLFGDLEELVHDTYHCEETYSWPDGSPCSRETISKHRPSNWLEILLKLTSPKAKKAHRFPFTLPKALSRSIVVELGAGLGQDTRNIARAGAWKVFGVEVSTAAVARARDITRSWGTKSERERIDYVAYDALALPAPMETIDLLFDFTVYCGLRHRYLDKLYRMWKRLLTPGHTLLMIQCWKETTRAPVQVRLEDMLLDFEPYLDVLHYESCEKNQLLGGKEGAWCVYLKMKK